MFLSAITESQLSLEVKEKKFFSKKKLFELPVVLINPLIEISTKQIFENLFLNSKKKEKFENEDINSEDLFLYLAKRRNDFKIPRKKFVQRLKKSIIF